MTTRQEFSKKTKLEAWDRCKGRCECGCRQKIVRPIYDHYPIPASLGGPATLENCRVLDSRCNRPITYQKDIPELAKSQRILEKRAGAREKRGAALPGTKRSGWKHKVNGEWVRR